MTWQYFIVGYFVFGASSYLCRRVLAQKLHDKNRLINASFFVLFLLPAAVVLGLIFPHSFSIGWDNFAYLALGSLIWPVFNIAAFKANKDIDVGVYSAINNLSPLFTLLVGLALLNEHLTTVQLFGIFLLVIAGFIATFPSLTKGSKLSKEGVLFCLLSTAMLGIAVAYEKFMLTRIDLGTYLMLGWSAQVAWMALLARKELRGLPELVKNKDTGRLTLLFGLTNVLKSACFILALQLSSSAAVVGASTNFMSIVVLIAAYFILRERQYMPYKVAATIVGVVGLVLV